MSAKQKQYLELLKIRQKGRKRDTIILGTVFGVSLLALVFLGITGQIAGRAIYLAAGMVAVFGVSYLMAWMRLEGVNNLIDLITQTEE